MALTFDPFWLLSGSFENGKGLARIRRARDGGCWCWSSKACEWQPQRRKNSRVDVTGPAAQTTCLDYIIPTTSPTSNLQTLYRHFKVTTMLPRISKITFCEDANSRRQKSLRSKNILKLIASLSDWSPKVEPPFMFECSTAQYLPTLVDPRDVLGPGS